MAKMEFYMKGYLSRPEENEIFFAKDGFIHTGDLGLYLIILCNDSIYSKNFSSFEKNSFFFHKI